MGTVRYYVCLLEIPHSAEGNTSIRVAANQDIGRAVHCHGLHPTGKEKGEGEILECDGQGIQTCVINIKISIDDR
jgi:hypothetical protein